MNIPFIAKNTEAQQTRRSHMTVGKSVATTVLAGLISLIVIIPFIWVFATSLKDRAEVARNPLGLPQEYHWENYNTAWTKGHFSTYFMNSVLVVVPTVVVVLFLAMLAAYSFARLSFRGKGPLFTILLIGLTIPMGVLIIPLFYLILDLNLYNSLWSIILPQISIGLPFAILLLRTFIQDLPQEIMDSGRIDGCNNWQLLMNIVVPLSRPALLSLLIFNFMWNWGSFLLPVILIQKESSRTLPLGLNFFIGRYTSDIPLLMAGTVISFLPVVILYILFQRQFIKGITAGALNY